MLWKRPGESVIIRWSCSDKVSQTSDFNKRNDFLIITEPGSPRPGVSVVVSLENSLWQQALFVPGVSPCSLPCVSMIQSLNIMTPLKLE